MESRGGKNRANWLPMGSDPPTGLQPSKNIKDSDGGPIVGEEGMVTSILEAFDLIYLATLIKLITKKTNKRAAVLYYSDNPPKFLLYWVNLKFSYCYKFIVVFLFMSILHPYLRRRLFLYQFSWEDPLCLS